jgi:hypothetical protein
MQIVTASKPKRLLIGGMTAALAILLGAGSVLAATAVDLTTADIQQGPYNGAYFKQGPLPSSAGTGVLDPFLRLNATGNDPAIEKGYNTDYRPLQFDEDGSWTEALLLSTVPTVAGPGGALYRVFYLDINQTNKDSLLSLDELILFGGSSPLYHGFDETARNFTAPGAATVLWSLDQGADRYLYMDYGLEAGSGDSDVTMLIPETVFAGYPSCAYGQAGCSTWLYLWNRFGDNFPNNDGFEEWSTTVLPYVQVAKTAAGTFDRTYSWTITKDYDGEYWKFIGDPKTVHDYKVVVDQSTVDSNIKVTGKITLTVPSKLPDGEKESPDATITNIVDTYAGKTATVTCPSPLPFTIKASKSGPTVVECTYEVLLDSVVTGTNNVEVTVEGNPTTFKASADVSAFTENKKGYPTINVTDDVYGALGSASADKTFDYTGDFACPTDTSLYKDGVYTKTTVNTATITETGQKDSATVKLNCYLPLVAKTAAGTFDKTYTWTITKDYDGEYWKLIGDPKAVHDYKVVVDQTITPAKFLVSGEITITNPNPKTAMSVVLSDKLSSGEAATLTDCTNPVSVPAGGSKVCKYSAGPASDAAGTNTATATLNAIDFKGEKAYTFTASVIGYPTINVTDDVYGALGSASADKTFDYTGDFACPTDTSLYKDGVYTKTTVNTATITETGQKDSATVKLNCYLPLVSKDAKTTYERTFDWKITKTAAKSELTLKIGQTYMLDYVVTVDKASTWYTDGKWMVSGTITVANPNPKASMTVDVADKLSGDIVAAVDCGSGATSLTVAAGGSGTCTYKADLPNATTRTNTATATLNMLTFSGTAEVTFGEPTSLVDECVKAYDDNATPGSTADDVYLGEVCYTDSLPKEFKFTRQIGPYQVCDLYKVINTAWIVTNDTKTLKDSSWQVAIDVPCEGCTLTQGYWKTHSKYGPAPYDPDWALVGEDTPFFTNGVSWYEMFWMAPKGGNPYVQLAHQWEAAYLNSIKSVDPAPFGDFQDEFNEASMLLDKYTYDGYDWKKDTDGVVPRFKYLANLFAMWNEGYLGPGHCDEDKTSSKAP